MKYIRRGEQVRKIYGLTDRQQKRAVVDGRLGHFHPHGDRGPCFFSVAELDALFEANAKPARKGKS